MSKEERNKKWQQTDPEIRRAAKNILAEKFLGNLKNMGKEERKKNWEHEDEDIRRAAKNILSMRMGLFQIDSYEEYSLYRNFVIGWWDEKDNRSNWERYCLKQKRPR